MECGKRREATAPIQFLVKLQPWFLSLQWKTCLRQNCSLSSCACREGPAIEQNTLMMMMMMMILSRSRLHGRNNKIVTIDMDLTKFSKLSFNAPYSIFSKRPPKTDVCVTPSFSNKESVRWPSHRFFLNFVKLKFHCVLKKWQRHTTHYSETLKKTAIIRAKKYFKYIMYLI